MVIFQFIGTYITSQGNTEPINYVTNNYELFRAPEVYFNGAVETGT
jgi:hypothetical protein